MAKGKVYKELINSRRWRQLRADIMAAHPCCQQCSANGRVRLATEVHHRIPVESVASKADQERLMFEVGNLMSVCNECHHELHRQMMRCTKQETRRRNSAKVSAFHRRMFGNDEADPT